MTTHPHLFPRVLITAALIFLGLGCAGAPKDLGNRSLVEGEAGPATSYAGREAPSLVGEARSALVIPDGAGGIIALSPAQENRNPGHVEARELKLQLRELGERLAAGIDDCALQGTVALPVSFVDLDDFNRSSALGRLMAEQLYHELHQRGYAVREYRLPPSIRVKKKDGEFALSRAVGKVAASSASVVVVGTYQRDKEAVFVNARLVRPKDGRVLRTASMVLAANALTNRLLYGQQTGQPIALPGGVLPIRDFAAATRPAPRRDNLSPFDRGEDIH
jgi:hypothetical protein